MENTKNNYLIDFYIYTRFVSLDLIAEAFLIILQLPTMQKVTLSLYSVYHKLQINNTSYPGKQTVSIRDMKIAGNKL